MRTRYACALDGAQLHAIAPEIIITDIAYDAPVRSIKTTQMAGQNGQRMLGATTNSQSVVVQFEIHTQSIARRRAVCEAVQRWAMAGGWLTTDDRPDQRLRVVCETLPSITSALRWTQRLSIGFTAFELPFWVDEFATVVTIAGNGEKSVYAPGYAAPAIVEGSVTNAGDTPITQIDLTAGETAFHLTGLTLEAGKALTFGYDAHHILYIREDGESALVKRTADSSDELLLEPDGTRLLSMSADGDAAARFEIRGCYL